MLGPGQGKAAWSYPLVLSLVITIPPCLKELGIFTFNFLLDEVSEASAHITPWWRAQNWNEIGLHSHVFSVICDFPSLFNQD